MAILFLTLCLVAVFGSDGQKVFSEIGNWKGDEMQVQHRRSEGGGGGGAAEGIEALLDRDEDDRCYGKRCHHSEECCRGTTCVDIEGAGTCLPSPGRQVSYQSCEDDSDCGAGLSCTDSGGSSTQYRTCQLDTASIHKKAGFNDECLTSSECDTDRGLCCQVLRRHRMATRRVCHYFLDPKSCVGDFRTDAKEIKFVANPFFKARLG